MAVQGDISYGLSIGAGQSVRRNAGDTDFEAYTPSSGGGDVSKVGTPVNNQIGVWTGDGTLEGDTALTFDTTTDTLATTLITATTVTANLTGDVTGNVSGSSGSCTGNSATATSATTATNLAGGSGGTIPYQSAAGTTAMLANGTAGQVLTSNGTTLAPTWTTISGFSWGASITGTTGTGSLLTMGNSYAAGGIGQSIVLGNTQSGATVMQKIDLGTSSHGHTGIYVLANNASTSARGIKVDLSTAGTGTAIEIISTPTTTGKAFAYNSSGTSTNVQANRSTDFFTIDVSRLGGSVGTWLDAFNVFYMKRTNATDTSGRNLTSSGSVLKLENIATPSLGTLSDTVDVLLLDQDTDSTGNIINARAGGTTKFAISATGALTTTPLTSGAVGFLNIPQNSQSAAYTTVAADSGKHIFHPSADTTARTFTIDSNANVAYPIGTAITFINQNSAGVVTIAITSDTMRLAGAGTTGSRTLAANGVAKAIKVTSTEWIINGTGLT